MCAIVPIVSVTVDAVNLATAVIMNFKTWSNGLFKLAHLKMGCDNWHQIYKHKIRSWLSYVTILWGGMSLESN